jgi:hypothetical protein
MQDNKDKYADTKEKARIKSILSDINKETNKPHQKP